MTNNAKLYPKEIFSISPVIPVIVIERIEKAVPLARALLAGGIRILEVTLRTKVALESIREIAENVPEVVVGAGTVLNSEQLQEVEKAGGKFAISPGITTGLLRAAMSSSITLIPGVSTVSEIMIGLEYCYSRFKFFPAEAFGGVKTLKAFSGPFPDIVFCPTGGLSQKNYNDYLKLSNVDCVGGSWITSTELVYGGEWSKITSIAKETVSKAVKIDAY